MYHRRYTMVLFQIYIQIQYILSSVAYSSDTASWYVVPQAVQAKQAINVIVAMQIILRIFFISFYAPILLITAFNIPP